MSVDIKQYRKEDLRVLADRFRKEGIFALLEMTYVDREQKGAGQASESRIATLKQVVLDALDYAAENASE